MKSKRFIVMLGFMSMFAACVQQPGADDHGWATVTSILESIVPPKFPENEFSILEFGAIPNVNADSKPAIEKAIEACVLVSGGKVIVPSGHYFFKGPIHLQSNIHLHISEGAYLSFSQEPSDYLPVVLTSWEGTRTYNYSPFIYAFGKSNVAITGTGTIDGNAGGVFNQWQKGQKKDQQLLRQMNNDNIPLEKRVFGSDHFLRPQLIQFYNCKNVLMQDVTILDAPFWCVHLVFSKNIVVDHLTFDSQQLNNDGVDVESCEDVLIKNVLFNNNDDNISIKAGRDREGRELGRPSRNIVVRNCQFKGHNAFAVGSEMSGGVSQVFVENCNFRGKVNNNGIYLKSNKDRGGKISDIYVRNVTFGQAGAAILIDSDYKNEGEGLPPRFENIHIENICAEEVGRAIQIKGTEEEPVDGVFLTNIVIQKAGKAVSIENAINVKMDRVTINGQIYQNKTIPSVN